MRFAFEISFMVFWIITCIIRYPFAKRNKSNQIEKDKKDTQEKWLLALAALGMILFPVLYFATPWLDFANYYLPNALAFMGLLLLPPAGILFYKSHSDLGRNWSAGSEIRDKHTLVSSGIYKYIRHPMYTAIWLWVIGQALLLQNYIGGLSGLLSFGLLYFLRVQKEEQMMVSQFGNHYVAYKQKTKRLIPYLF